MRTGISIALRALAVSVSAIICGPSLALAAPDDLGASAAGNSRYDLSGTEARVVLWRGLQRHFEYGTVDGSDTLSCRSRRRNGATCFVTFQDLDFDWWCGYGYVTEHPSRYVFAWRLRLC